MRIVTGTISHETNVFSNIATDLEEFKKRCVVYGDALFDRFSGTKTPAGGIIEGCRLHRAIIADEDQIPRHIPTEDALHEWVMPAGPEIDDGHLVRLARLILQVADGDQHTSGQP